MITFILGTRPEILKLGSVIKEIPQDERCIIWTGQHWSPELFYSILEDVDFKPMVKIKPFVETLSYYPEKDPRISGPHDHRNDAVALGYLVGNLTDMLWINLAYMHPIRWVVVQGDTTSALAGALAAAKLGIPVYHVEAGSRSGNREQPEELNRILIDRIATGWSAAYHCDRDNLKDEGIKGAQWHGDTLIDSMLEWKEQAGEIKTEGGGVLATIHRAETLNNREALAAILEFLMQITQIIEDWPVTLFMHPHLKNVLAAHGMEVPKEIVKKDPLPPGEFRAALASCQGFITDSGGAATEAAWLGVRCIMAREVTELKDLVACRRVVIGGRSVDSLSKACRAAVPYWPPSNRVERSWRGGAGKRIAEELLSI